MSYATKYHYEANKEAYKKRARERTKKIRQEILEYKSNNPCADCGIQYPGYIMDFDHIGKDKITEVANLTRNSAPLKRIMEEINKCEVVCANCHRERTHQRLQNHMSQVDMIGASSCL